MLSIDCSEMKENFWPIKQWLEILFHFRTVYIRQFLENIVRCVFYNGRAYITKLTKANLSKDRTSLLTSLQESQGE